MNQIICITSSDSEEDTIKKKAKQVIPNKKDEIKANVRQKRKLSLNSSQENIFKKHKLLENKMVFIDTQNCNEIFSNAVIEDIKNEHLNNFDHLRSNSENRNLSDNCSSSKLKVSTKPKQITNKLSKKTELIKESNNSFSMKPSSSQQYQPTRKFIKPQLVVKEKIPIPDDSDNMFAKFIETCKRIRKDNITEKILHKLEKRYNKIDSVIKNNVDFKLILSGVIKKMLKNREEKFYTYIQEVSDEIKRYNNELKTVKSDKDLNIVSKESNEMKNIDDRMILKNDKELSKDDMKKVKKLENAINKCQKKIKELEMQEVDFNDEEDSTYIQEDRYKRKLIELYALLSKIIGDSTIKREIYKKQLRCKDISSEMTGIKLIDEAIIDLVNARIKRVNKLKHIKNHTAIADFLPVPDYEDILQCISKCNAEKNFGLKKTKVEELAKSSFQSVGKYLKKQRIIESKNCIFSYIETEEDPALNNDELNKKLLQNKKEGDKKLEEVFKIYVKMEEEAFIRGQKQTESPVCNNENKNEDEKNKPDEKEDTIDKIFVLNKDEKSEEKEKDLTEYNKLNQEKTNDLVQKDKLCLEKENDTDEENRLYQENDKDIINKQTTNILEFNNNSELKNISFKSASDSKKLESKNNINKDDICQKENLLKNNLDENISINSVSNEVKGISNVLKANNEEAFCILELCGINECSKYNHKNPLSKIEHEEIEILSDEEVNLNDNLNKNIKENINLLNDNNCVIKDTMKLNPFSSEINIKRNKDDKSNPTLLINNKNRISKDSKIQNDVDILKTVHNITENETVTRNNELQSKNTYSNQNNNENNSNNIASRTSNNINTVLETNNANVNCLSSMVQIENIVQEGNDNKKISSPIKKNKGSLEVMDIVEDIQIENTHENVYKTVQGINIIFENKITANEKETDTNIQDKCAPEELSSFIKVRSFAKPPDSWKDSLSPEKVKQNVQTPVGQVYSGISNPECVDLTTEKESRLPSTSTRIINPLAISNRCMPIKNVVAVKNVINNCRVTVPQNDTRGPKFAIARNVRIINPQNKRNVIYIPNASSVLLNHIPTNNINQNSNTLTTNIITRPYTTVMLQKKSNP